MRSPPDGKLGFFYSMIAHRRGNPVYTGLRAARKFRGVSLRALSPAAPAQVFTDLLFARG
jgi:hypothetical protein